MCCIMHVMNRGLWKTLLVCINQAICFLAMFLNILYDDCCWEVFAFLNISNVFSGSFTTRKETHTAGRLIWFGSLTFIQFLFYSKRTERTIFNITLMLDDGHLSKEPLLRTFTFSRCFYSVFYMTNITSNLSYKSNILGYIQE